ALRDIGYSRAAVMEPFVMPGGTIGSEIKVWRDLVGDTSEEALDRDAEGALRFVRHVFGF
ncbi:MAG: dolichol monophosphate mannose synthase, partial [Lachnospiraceae bacterium]|nr:dolichol monophosphate mannose synthase [Lachnospiraceae bacterium]